MTTYTVKHRFNLTIAVASLAFLLISTPNSIAQTNIQPVKASTKKKKKSCSPKDNKSSKTVFKNSQGRVFSKKVSSDETYYFGCLNQYKRKVKLTSDDSSEGGTYSFNDPVFAGRYLAYWEESFDDSGEGANVISVFDMKTGQREAQSINTAGDVGVESDWTVSDLFLSSKGRVLFLNSLKQDATQARLVFLYGDDERVLDTGNILKGTLKVVGSKASWVKDSISTGTDL